MIRISSASTMRAGGSSRCCRPVARIVTIESPGDVHPILGCVRDLPPGRSRLFHVATRAHAAIEGASPELKPCIERALSPATFACPQAGSEVDVTAVLSIGAYDH